MNAGNRLEQVLKDRADLACVAHLDALAIGDTDLADATAKRFREASDALKALAKHEVPQ